MHTSWAAGVSKTKAGFCHGETPVPVSWEDRCRREDPSPWGPRGAAHPQGLHSHALRKEGDGSSSSRSPVPCHGALGSPPPLSPANLGRRCCLPAPGTGKLLFGASTRKGPPPCCSSCIPSLGALSGAWRAHSTPKSFPAQSPRPSLLPTSPRGAAQRLCRAAPPGSFESAPF